MHCITTSLYMPYTMQVLLEGEVRPLTLPSVREEGEGEGEGERGSSRCGENDTAAGTTGLPTSPSWRRSPSYEQLQQIELDPHRLVKSSRGGTGSSLRASPPHSSDRRALTLSVSGSEAESIYGKASLCAYLTLSTWLGVQVWYYCTYVQLSVMNVVSHI